MNLLVTLLVYLVVFGLVYFIVEYILASLGVGPKLQGIVKAVLALIALIIILMLFFGTGMPVIKIT